MFRHTSIGAAAFVFALVTVAGPALAQTSSRPVVRDAAAELACGPQVAFVAPAPALRIAGGPERGRMLFATGETVIISGGTSQGLAPGQVYFVRRAITDRFASPMSGGVLPISLHTAGWVRIEDAHAEMAVATIVQSCDSIEPGDYLEPFVLPTFAATSSAATEPDYSAPGHVILGDERRQIGAAGSLMVLDRGSDHGVRSGQRLTIYRETMDGRGPVARIGQATAMVVNAETTLIRIDSSNDAVSVGDRVALHR